MDYISVKEAAGLFNISERRVQKLCESQRIEGAKMISSVWIIPGNAVKPMDERLSTSPKSRYSYTLNELCDTLSISTATGRNWVKLGKLIPDHMEKRTPVFTKDYVEKLKNELKTGDNSALKSRRNKKYVSGHALYNSYVSEGCKNLLELQKLLSIVEDNKVELTEEVIQLLLADCALHLFADKQDLCFINDRNLLAKFLNNEISTGKYDELIRCLIVDDSMAIQFCRNNERLFDLDYKYEGNEDVLGLIYISCKNIGNRKATGSYYTSTKIVKKLIHQLDIEDEDRILDPCCGTGNFLLQLPQNVKVDNIYGIDIDKVSIKITRLNLSLKYDNADIITICKHITNGNYLLDKQSGVFSFIIGNPPWGYDFSEDESDQLRKQYYAATGRNIESYDVFIEQGLKHLASGGILSYVLPEAVLNVKAHMPIRQYILSNKSIKYLACLGNAFDGVQCPCIILQLENTDAGFSTIGMRVDDGIQQFSIEVERNVDAEYFSFTTTDQEYEIIRKVSKRSDVEYLLGNADFALGIVTGNNKEYITNVKTDYNEMVLKGSDVCKYHINKTDNYVAFRPETFQQVAPTEMYRAKEKLLYRFICSQLVFAYDDKQTLSLNSCNIVIPRAEGLEIKYILAILNSRIAQFIYRKQYNSIKVLRSHIESIPLPKVDMDQQREIIQLAEKLINGQSNDNTTKIYNEIDDKISDVFELTDKEREIIKLSLGNENLFLF